MKSRWIPGKIIKTQPGSFTNYQGDFTPGIESRSSDFDSCYEVLEKSISLIGPSEFVITYSDPDLDPVHTVSNLRLVNTADIEWLAHARKIIHPALPQSSTNKIAVKSYKTDRAQTGTDQTNRAKRWEILSSDFQTSSRISES